MVIAENKTASFSTVQGKDVCLPSLEVAKDLLFLDISVYDKLYRLPSGLQHLRLWLLYGHIAACRQSESYNITNIEF